MYKYLLTILFFYLPLTCISQKNYYAKSMNVTKSDLIGSTYQKDTTANAFYIYEKGYSKIIKGNDNYLKVNTEYERKIKILNKKGYDKAKIEIYLYKGKNGSEKIKNLVAQTYNLDNENIITTKVLKNNIYKENHSESFDIIRFTFPNLKPGSVIKYSYQITSPYIYNFNGWDFQDDIPKQYSEYVTDLPGNYIYNIRLIGPLKLTTEENSVIKKCLTIDYGVYADCSHNKYTMEDIPAFREEKYMTAKKNYFSRVAYELKESKGFDGINKKFTETWQNVDDKLKKHPTIGIQLKKINATKNILPIEIKSLALNIEKAKKIYSYLTKNYTWNNSYRIFDKTNIKEIIRSKTGNVGSINILLHNILKQQGFTVTPVLLSTRKNGYATKIHPVITNFNYILIKLTVDDKSYLLDATEKKLAFGQIPFRCLNKYGRELDFKNGSSWIDIEPNNRSIKYYKEQTKLTTENKLESTSSYVYSGYHALNKRKAISNLSEEKQQKNIGPTGDHIEVIDTKIIDEEILENPLKEEFSLAVTPDEIENIIYIKPYINPFFEENPFKLNKRTYPVDFGYKRSYNYIVSIEIPSSYTFLDIPKSTHYVLPDNLGKLVTSYEQKKNMLLISHQIILFTTYYPTKYYSALKDFFNYIVDIENNTVITIKKS